MPNPTWNAGTADWTTAADWSTGAVPGAGDNVSVESGDGPPQVTSNVPTIASLVDQGEVDVLSGGTLTVTGDLAPTDADGGGAGILVLDASGGAANAVMNVGGALVNSVQPPTFVFPEQVNFAQIALTGGTSSQAALNFTTAAAGIGGAGIIGAGGADGGTIASVTLTGNAQITFASGGITTLAPTVPRWSSTAPARRSPSPDRAPTARLPAWPPSVAPRPMRSARRASSSTTGRASPRPRA